MSIIYWQIFIKFIELTMASPYLLYLALFRRPQVM